MSREYKVNSCKEDKQNRLSKEKDSNILQLPYKAATLFTQIYQNNQCQLGIAKKSETTSQNRIPIQRYQSCTNKEMDPRDQIVQIPINFTLPDGKLQTIDIKNMQTSKGNIKKIDIYHQNISDWLVESLETILSVAFNHLRRDNLTQSEAKAFSAKNILYSIKEFCHRCKGMQDEGRRELVGYLDSQVSKIIGALLAKYPQTSAKGASQRIRNRVRAVDKRASDEFDFLLKHNLSFRLNKEGDYSSDILRTLNGVIGLGNEVSGSDEDEVTLYEDFKQFLERLILHTPEKPIKAKDYAIKSSGAQGMKVGGCLRKQSEGDSAKQRDQIMKILSERIADGEQDQFQTKASSLTRLKVSTKIPGGVELYSQQQVRLGDFKAKNSAVLRVLVKWGEQLLEKIDNSTETVKEKIQKFKTTDNDLIFLAQKDREVLARQLSNLREAGVNLRKVQHSQSLQLLGKFAFQVSQGQSVRRYTDVGVFAARVHEVASKQIFRVVNKLIHLLLSLTSKSSFDVTNSSFKQDDEYNVNLITLKVGDLLRAKYCCREPELLNLLDVIYALDNHQPNLFRLVRIKNRLDQKDNDLLINFLFRNRVLCELQLSVLSDISKKEQQYSAFNHFLYEVCRSKLGSLSELACIAVQHDPLISLYARSPTYGPKLKASLQQDIVKYSKSTPEGPFICDICRQLRSVPNPQFFPRRPTDPAICNSCLQDNIVSDKDRKNEFLISASKEMGLKINGEKIQQISIWSPSQKLKGSEQTLSYKFLSRGLFVEKNFKQANLQYFIAVVGNYQNQLLLATLDGKDQPKIFLKVDLLIKDGKLSCLSKLKKYLFFQIPLQQDQFWSSTLLPQDSKHLLTSQNVLRSEDLAYIRHCLSKKEEVLYLPGREGIVDIYSNYLQVQDKKLSEKRRLQFMQSAPNILYLELERCGINTVNTFALGKFINLKELNISYNNLQSLTNHSHRLHLGVNTYFSNIIKGYQAFSKMEKLQKLNLSHNQIQSVQGLPVMRSLQCLDLSHNRLKICPDLNHMKEVRNLNLRGNNIQKIIGLGLSKLINLDLSNNQIQLIEGLNDHKDLHCLDLSGNKITEIENLHDCERLTRLYLNKNRIQKIKNLNGLPLRILHLNENQIAKIQNLETLLQLKNLSLSHNLIEQAYHLDQVRDLQKVDLSFNAIISFQSILRSQQYQFLNLEGNPLQRNFKFKKFEFNQLLKGLMTRPQSLREDMDSAMKFERIKSTEP